LIFVILETVQRFLFYAAQNESIQNLNATASRQLKQRLEVITTSQTQRVCNRVKTDCRILKLVRWGLLGVPRYGKAAKSTGWAGWVVCE